jgi:hypothetical protein
MAPSTAEAGSAKAHEKDLSQILTPEECVELTLLIANIAEVMEKQIQDTFDASITSKPQPQQTPQIKTKNSDIDASGPTKETEEEQKAQKLREKREKELSAPKMLELKREALQFFYEWRGSVIVRVGVVVNNPKEVVDKQKKKASVEATPNTAPPRPKTIRKQSTFLIALSSSITVFS